MPRRSRNVVAVVLAIYAALALLLAIKAHADECNPDLVSSRTPLCQLYKPQFRQCRTDIDLDKDMDILDHLCTLCPPGEFLEGFDGGGMPVCSGVGCTPFVCAPPTVQIGVDANCHPVCSTDFCTPNPCCNGGACILQGNGFICLCPCGFTGDSCQTPITTTTTAAPTTTTITTTTVTTTTITTTTTTTTTTTVTTTSTSTSTTTLVPIESLWAPEWPVWAQDRFPPLMDDTLYCSAWMPTHSLTNADGLAWITAGSGTCGLAIYNADGSTRLLSSGGLNCSPSSLQVVTGLSPSATINAGTKLQVCFCAVSGFLQFKSSDSTNGLDAIQNAFSGAPLSTVAANPCTSSAPPATTGTLSASVHGAVIVHVQQSGAP